MGKNCCTSREKDAVDENGQPLPPFTVKEQLQKING
jgi:hypothetical protein